MMSSATASPIKKLLRDFVAAHSAPYSRPSPVARLEVVYVLNRAVDCEGEETLGVFGDEQSAINAAKAHKHEELQSFIDVHGCTFWADSEHSSIQFYARAFPVR